MMLCNYVLDFIDLKIDEIDCLILMKFFGGCWVFMIEVVIFIWVVVIIIDDVILEILFYIIFIIIFKISKIIFIWKIF